MPVKRTCLGCGAKVVGASRCARCKREAERTRPTRPHRNGSTRAWRATRLRILKRDGYRCTHTDPHGRRCTYHEPPGVTPSRLHIDHIVALAKGGADDDSNLRVLCRRHNLAKGARTLRG